MLRTTVEVRRATSQDVDLLLTLAQRARLGEQLPPRPESLAVRTRALTALDRPDVTVFLACAGQEPVGAIVLRVGEILPLSCSDAVHIEQLFVDQDWRRRGVARQLLGAAATVAEHLGTSDVVCTTPSGVRESQRFLARLGFTPLVVQRAVPVATLRRKLAAGGGTARRKAAVELVLARRRREARTRTEAVTLEAHPAAGR
jgi:GNAT superfamily N-acetyltransferase